MSEERQIKPFRWDDRKYHLVTQFEDEGKRYFVFKFFGRYHQYWHYEIWSEYEYDLKMKLIHAK